MTKTTRLTILLVCGACFLVIAPILIFYSMGYRFDFKKMEVTETGGIYVRTFPAAEEITIDSRINVKPGLFANSIFVQSLLPNNHSVSVKKAGYYDYYKTIPVVKEQVTKLENILLIKKNIQFSLLNTNPEIKAVQSPFNALEKFVIKNNNLYYSNNLDNSALTATQKLVPVLKKISAFVIQNNNIIWLGSDGFLYKSDQSALVSEPIKITQLPIKIIKSGVYKIILDDKNIFVNNNGSLLLLNSKTNSLDNFYSPVKGAKISPQGDNIVYYDDNNIFISPILTSPFTKNILYKSSEKINDFSWINNSYIAFTTGPASPSQGGNKIIISEIDFRGNINNITLPQTITVSSGEKINLTNPRIFFNQQENKLYILNGKDLIVSEKITP